MLSKTSLYLPVIFLVANVCCREDCNSRCDWLEWEPWSSCSTSCGGFGSRDRNRPLCCPADIETLTECVDFCGLQYDDSWVTESCNRICLNGGTINQGDYYCACAEKYTGICCEQEKPRSLKPEGIGNCDDLCTWSPWALWSTCSVSCGGGGEQERVRYLCCLEEYGSFDGCLQHCGKNASDLSEKRSCGDTCFYGGTIKTAGLGCDCLNRTFGHCCEELLPGCTPFPTDVIFVLDSSASQTEDLFHVQLDFVAKFVENVNVSAEEFQIAVVTFSTEAKVEISFNQSTSVDNLRQLIGDIRFRPGATFTDKGLLLAMDVARKSERRKGMVTLTYAFVLTDGMSNKRAETRLAAAKLKDSAVHVIAIGIGHEVSHKELRDIASPGDEFSPSYVFSVGDLNALDTLLKQLVHVTCDNCSTTSQLSDIVFLLDNGNDMSEEEFQLSVDVMESIIGQSDNIGEADGPLFGIFQLGNKLESKVKMSTSQTKLSLLVDLQTLHRTETDTCVKERECNRNNITSVVEFILESAFEESLRENPRKFLVVITTGRFMNTALIKKEMSAIQKESEVKIFVIGPGIDIEMGGLLSLATEANHVYVVIDKDDTSKLDVMQSEFSYNVCKKS